MSFDLRYNGNMCNNILYYIIYFSNVQWLKQTI